MVIGLPSRRSAADLSVRPDRPQAEGYQPRPFGCGVGSPFHHSRAAQAVQPCSRRSQVLCRCQTSRRRTRQDYGHRPSLTDPPPPCGANRRVLPGSPGSRAWSVHACTGSQTPRGRCRRSRWRHASYCLPGHHTRSAPRNRRLRMLESAFEPSGRPTAASAGEPGDLRRRNEQTMHVWWPAVTTPGATRTRNLLLRRQALYPLSYGRNSRAVDSGRSGAKSQRRLPGRGWPRPIRQAAGG